MTRFRPALLRASARLWDFAPAMATLYFSLNAGARETWSVFVTATGSGLGDIRRRLGLLVFQPLRGAVLPLAHLREIVDFMSEQQKKQ